MNLQWAGIILAFTTFATIGLGHELVRRLHKRFGTTPRFFFWALALAALVWSFFAADLTSAALGIISITFFWDGIEMIRQEKRMRREMETK